MSDHQRFTVEPCPYKGEGIGEWAIRYTPPRHIAEDGSMIVGLSFPALLASAWLGNQEKVLKQLAHKLNNQEALGEAVEILQRIVDAIEVPDPADTGSTIVESLPRHEVEDLVFQALVKLQSLRMPD